jgi:hypothetical protein
MREFWKRPVAVDKDTGSSMARRIMKIRAMQKVENTWLTSERGGH